MLCCVNLDVLDLAADDEVEADGTESGGDGAGDGAGDSAGDGAGEPGSEGCFDSAEIESDRRGARDGA